MLITKLIAKNFKVLKAVEIEANGPGSIIISGKNGAGKTSVLDAIALAVAGKKFANSLTKPIREGEEKASVSVETDNGLFITRTWTQNGTPGKLIIKDNEDRKYSSPQAFLDKLIGNLSFDPLSFANSKPVEQRATLLSIIDLPIDLDDLKTKRDDLFSQRTESNREAKKKSNQMEEMNELVMDLPKEEISSKDLLEEYQKALNTKNEYQNLEEKNKLFLKDIDLANRKIQNLKDEIKEITQEIEEEKENLKHIENEQLNIDKKLEEYISPNFNEIQQRIDEVEGTNKQIREAKKYADDKKERDFFLEKSKKLTEAMEKIDKEKEDALAKAKFPINKLGFDEEGIIYQGIPFQQCSLSEKLKVSIAISMVLNPEFKVIRVTDASLLDEKNMEVIERMAKKKGFQVWLEVVDSSGDVGICIEDGSVVEKN